jgi:arylsulfatase A-like enzyme
MRALELTGQLDDTLVLFLTDHGEYLGDFGLVEKWPSGMDRCLLQNPVIFAGPGIAENRVADSFAEMVDILPTLLEIADIEPKHTHFGRSLVPVLKRTQSSTSRSRLFGGRIHPTRNASFRATHR